MILRFVPMWWPGVLNRSLHSLLVGCLVLGCGQASNNECEPLTVALMPRPEVGDPLGSRVLLAPLKGQYQLVAWQYVLHPEIVDRADEHLGWLVTSDGQVESWPDLSRCGGSCYSFFVDQVAADPITGSVAILWSDDVATLPRFGLSMGVPGDAMIFVWTPSPPQNDWEFTALASIGWLDSRVYLVWALVNGTNDPTDVLLTVIDPGNGTEDTIVIESNVVITDSYRRALIVPAGPNQQDGAIGYVVGQLGNVNAGEVWEVAILPGLPLQLGVPRTRLLGTHTLLAAVAGDRVPELVTCLYGGLFVDSGANAWSVPGSCPDLRIPNLRAYGRVDAMAGEERWLLWEDEQEDAVVATVLTEQGQRQWACVLPATSAPIIESSRARVTWTDPQAADGTTAIRSLPLP